MTPITFFHTIERLAFPLAALLAVVWVGVGASPIPLSVQIVGLAVVVVALGLPHGALDPWIAQSMRMVNGRLQRWVFDGAYVLVCAAVIVAWVWAPVVCLAVFLLISAWHFSGDWSATLHWVWQRSVGVLLLLMPIGFHTPEVAWLFAHLSGEGGAVLAFALALPAWWLAAWMAVIVVAAVVQQQSTAALEVLALLVLAWTVPPLIYFALYFCLLHSPRHMANIFRQAPHPAHAQLLRMMLWYTLASVVGLGVLAWLWSATPANTQLLRVVFVGLAAVTVPHMMLIGAVSWRRR